MKHGSLLVVCWFDLVVCCCFGCDVGCVVGCAVFVEAPGQQVTRNRMQPCLVGAVLVCFGRDEVLFCFLVSLFRAM